MTVAKDFRFHSSVRWLGHGVTQATVPGKAALRVGVPVEFRGAEPGTWSPEDLIVTAVASCYAVTFAAVAERRGLAPTAISVDGVGHVESGRDGRLGFIAIELHAAIEAPAAALGALEEAARAAEQLCIVQRALDVPVHLELDLLPAEAARGAA